MPLTEQLRIGLSKLDGRALPVFREGVGLTKHGRLGDAWDQEFGSRVIRPREQGWVRLDLYRYSDETWGISLTYEKDPLPPDEVEALRRQIIAAAAQAGVTVTTQSSESPSTRRAE